MKILIVRRDFFTTAKIEIGVELSHKIIESSAESHDSRKSHELQDVNIIVPKRCSGQDACETRPAEPTSPPSAEGPHCSGCRELRYFVDVSLPTKV